jgi:hypothetical protein
MPPTEMVVMVGVLVAALLTVLSLIRLLAMAMTHKTIRRAMADNPELAQPLLAQLASPNPADGDSRLSIILIAVGAAMVVGSVIINDPAWMHYAIAAAGFPLIVGTALWLRLFIAERTRRRGTSE